MGFQVMYCGDQYYPVFTDVSATVIAKLPCHTIVLLELFGGSSLVLETLKGDLGCETIVSSKRPLAAVAMAKCGSRIVQGVEF